MSAIATSNPLKHPTPQCQLKSWHLNGAFEFRAGSLLENIFARLKYFRPISEHLGNKFKASKIDSEVKSVQLKNALDLLVKAGVAYKCFHSSAQGAPLAMGKNYDKFKTYFFDTGLVMRLLKLDLRQWVTTPLNINFIGSIAKQFVAQELVAYSDPNVTGDLYYWHRESKSSRAAIDFLTMHHDHIVPIEVKAYVKGGMKSLAIFLDSHLDAKYGLKISERYYSKHGKLVEIPFYGIESWMKSIN